MGQNPLDNSISPARLSPRSRYGSPGRRGFSSVWLFVTRIWNQIIGSQKHIGPNPSASFVGSSPKGEPKHPSSYSNEQLQQIAPKHVHIYGLSLPTIQRAKWCTRFAADRAYRNSEVASVRALLPLAHHTYGPKLTG
jgi:hypothetical protein